MENIMVKASSLLQYGDFYQNDCFICILISSLSAKGTVETEVTYLLNLVNPTVKSKIKVLPTYPILSFDFQGGFDKC